MSSECLSVYVSRFHVYLLYDPCCGARCSSVIAYNEPACCHFDVDLFNVSLYERIPHLEVIS